MNPSPKALLLVPTVLAVATLVLAGCSTGSEPAPVPTSTVVAAPPEGTLFNQSEDGMAATMIAEELSSEGLPEAEAVALIERAGLPYRIVMRDDEAFPVTADYVPSRINLAVEGGVVVDASTG